MPVYNAEEHLDEAIKSIISQSFKDFEFIIINDASIDNSKNIILSYNDRRIRYVENKQNLRIIKSINKGLTLSKGRYIARMDADDISLPRRFEMQVALLEKENLDICGCHYAVINKTGKYTDMIYTPLNDNSLMLYMAISVPFAHGSVMINKISLDSNNLNYSQGFLFAEDKALWLKMYDLNLKFGNVDEVLFKYRDVDNSLTKKYSSKIISDHNMLKRKFITSYEHDINIAINNLSNNISTLSHREIEHLSDLTLQMLFHRKKMRYWHVFRRLPYRYTALSIIKLTSNFFAKK